MPATIYISAMPYGGFTAEMREGGRLLKHDVCLGALQIVRNMESFAAGKFNVEIEFTEDAKIAYDAEVAEVERDKIANRIHEAQYAREEIVAIDASSPDLKAILKQAKDGIAALLSALTTEARDIGYRYDSEDHNLVPLEPQNA